MWNLSLSNEYADTLFAIVCVSPFLHQAYYDELRQHFPYSKQALFLLCVDSLGSRVVVARPNIRSGKPYSWHTRSLIASSERASKPCVTFGYASKKPCTAQHAPYVPLAYPQSLRSLAVHTRVKKHAYSHGVALKSTYIDNTHAVSSDSDGWWTKPSEARRALLSFPLRARMSSSVKLAKWRTY